MLNDRLVADLRARRLDALDELLDRYGPEIHAVAFLVLRNASDAEEVTSDTLLVAWRKIGGLRDPGRLRPWLLRIATRLALRRSRLMRPRHVVPLELADELIAYPSPTLDRLVVGNAIDRLPPRMRAAVALHHVIGLSVPQTAEALGRSENTVKSQLREATARLRRDLAADYRPGMSATTLELP